MIFVKSMDNPHCATAFFYENNKWKEIKKIWKNEAVHPSKKLKWLLFYYTTNKICLQVSIYNFSFFWKFHFFQQKKAAWSRLFLSKKYNPLEILEKLPRELDSFQLVFMEHPVKLSSHFLQPVTQFHWILSAGQILQFPLNQLPNQPSPEFRLEW